MEPGVWMVGVGRCRSLVCRCSCLIRHQGESVLQYHRRATQRFSTTGTNKGVVRSHRLRRAPSKGWQAGNPTTTGPCAGHGNTHCRALAPHTNCKAACLPASVRARTVVSS